MLLVERSNPVAIQKTRPITVYVLMATLLFQAVSAIGGGYGLVADPSGAGMQMPLELLAGSPFNDYFIPGLILLVVLGIGPLVVLYGLWTRRAWGWYGAILVGLALMIWIVVQIALLGYMAWPPLQLVYGLLGLVIAGLALLPPVRTFYNPV
jgi:hypothetical protein